MEQMFTVVTDETEIKKLNHQLRTRLRKVLKHRTNRIVSYPAGQFVRPVYFESVTGSKVRALAAFDEETKFVNFCMTGDPSTNTAMLIDVQLNFPLGAYNKRMAGAFVRDRNNEVFIAHRGKLTRGRAAMHQADVLNEFASMTIEAQDGKSTSRLILISSLKALDLVDRLWAFAAETREVATKLASAATVGGAPVGRSPGSAGKAKPKDALMRLQAYFDEYAGQGHSKGHGGGQRTVEHGAIVRALEAVMREKGDTKKAQAIDLAVVAADVVLFEVKTEARTTDIYTGAGQLLIHGACIEQMLSKSVRRFLVLPQEPQPTYRKSLWEEGNIGVVTFTHASGRYQFKGLPA
jgi:hypothetical protein